MTTFATTRARTRTSQSSVNCTSVIADEADYILIDSMRLLPQITIPDEVSAAARLYQDPERVKAVKNSPPA